METLLSPQMVAERGDAFYASRLRALVEPQHVGNFLILDIESGDYEIDDDEIIAEERLLTRRPDGVLYTIRVGSPTAYFLGAGQ